MLERILSGHVDSLERAMSRSTQRQSVLMSNLANANVPGYKRRDVDFHVALDEQLQGADARLSQTRGAGSNDSSVRVDGSNVDLEREVLGIAETELRFGALADMTARYFSGLKNVIREGR